MKCGNVHYRKRKGYSFFSLNKKNLSSIDKNKVNIINKKANWRKKVNTYNKWDVYIYIYISP